MVREAAQRGRSGSAIITARERKPQNLGSNDGIFLEKLEEVPHTEEKDAARILFLDFVILLHQRGYSHYASPIESSIWSGVSSGGLGSS